MTAPSCWRTRCRKEEVEEVEVPPVTTPPVTTPPATEGAAAPGTTDGAAASEVSAAMAELSEADRTAALAQKICPVSDELYPVRVQAIEKAVTLDPLYCGDHHVGPAHHQDAKPSQRPVPERRRIVPAHQGHFLNHPLAEQLCHERGPPPIPVHVENLETRALPKQEACDPDVVEREVRDNFQERKRRGAGTRCWRKPMNPAADRQHRIAGRQRLYGGRGDTEAVHARAAHGNRA